MWASQQPPTQEEEGRRGAGLEHLPGVAHWPAQASLLGMILRRISKYWEFHKEYDQYHLANLPTPLRALLLSYLAAYGPEEGLDLSSLKRVLEPEESSDDFAGNDDFDRLDVSGSLGRGLTLKSIKGFVTSTEVSGSSQEQEDWDASPSSIPRVLSTKITNLRYLSIAHPHGSKNLWSSLLSLAPLLPTLSHLSLAHWPTPEITPNSKTATMHTSMHRVVNYSGTGFYAHSLDQDWSEAAGILRRLSTSLYSLEWLDLSGCSTWVRALRWGKTPGIDWVGKWGRIRTLKLLSDIDILAEPVMSSSIHVTPSNIPDKPSIIKYKLRVVEAMEVEKWIRQLRGWIDVQYDDFEAYDRFLDPRNEREEARLMNRGLLRKMKTEWVNEGEAYERRLRSRWDDDGDE